MENDAGSDRPDTPDPQTPQSPEPTERLGDLADPSTASEPGEVTGAADMPPPPPPVMGDVPPPPPAGVVPPSTPPAADPFAAPPAQGIPAQGIPATQTVPVTPTPPDDDAEGSFFSKQVLKLPVAAWLGIVGVLIAAGAFAVFSGGGDEPQIGIDLPSVVPPSQSTVVTIPETIVETTVPDTTTPETTTPETTVPDTTTPTTTPTTLPATTIIDGRSPETAFPMGEPGVSAFVIGHEYSETAWEGELAGVYEIGYDDFADATCYAVLGTITATSAGGLLADGYEGPAMTITSGGDDYPAEYLSCGDQSLMVAGYTALAESLVTVGTPLPFYTEFAIPEGIQDDATLAVAPGGGGEAEVYFQVGLLDEYPPADVQLGNPIDLELTSNAVEFELTDDFDDSTWRGQITGTSVISTSDLGDFGEGDGSCYAVYGTFTVVETKGVIAAPFTAPDVRLMIGGRAIARDSYNCSEDAADIGYESTFDAAVTAGTAFSFYENFFVPSALDVADPAVLVGSPWESGGGAVLVDAAVSAEIIPPVISPGVPAAVEGRPTGTPAVHVDPYNDDTWDINIFGMINTEPSFSDGTCFVVLGMMTPTAVDGGDTIESYLAPAISMIQDGRLRSDTYLSCEVDEIEAAGYRDVYADEALTVGEAFPFYVGILIPEASTAEPQVIVAGDPFGEDALFFMPTPLDAIPAL